jgi:hypothetical protein
VRFENKPAWPQFFYRSASQIVNGKILDIRANVGVATWPNATLVKSEKEISEP